MNSDILIIGGGVIGLSIARELRKRAAGKITLLEKGVVGQESSWAAAGMLGPQAEADKADTFFEMCSVSRDLYPEFAAELKDETGLDVELDRSGTLYLSFSEKDSQALDERYRWQSNAGLNVQKLSAADIRKAEPFVSPDVRDGLLFSDDWQVENRKLLSALKKYADLNEIEIRENEKIEELIVEAERVVGARTAAEEFRADTTILATGAWTSLIKLGRAEIPLAIEPVRGQIIAFQTTKRLFCHVIYSHRGYVVPRTDGQILAGSTSESVGFEKATTEIAAIELREMASEIAPGIANLKIADHWSGLRPFAADGLPVMGELSGLENMIVATAHYRNGILLAPITAKLVAEKLAGAEPEYFSEFSPERFSIRGVGRSV